MRSWEKWKDLIMMRVLMKQGGRSIFSVARSFLDAAVHPQVPSGIVAGLRIHYPVCACRDAVV
ncbi:hypothetical protein HMPREF3038_02746 [Akkermansia sp. KLE1797]|nr:hypothetical protein HMPREF3038_02746 [Akkermansia sp. KLE1797]KXU53151.1 hypothetical protein HMPREF3039_02707 [Akkermansia sp. KLE1798]